MSRGEGWWLRWRADPGRSVLVAAVLVLGLAADPAAAERRLSWRPLAVEARLDAEGVLWVRESHTMVFTGDWNGGERVFDLRSDQSLDLLALTRLDAATGEQVPLVEGPLARVDEYDWVDRRTLRWRSRRPSDPPFEETPITYVIEYRQEGVLQPRGDRYLLDHDFAFPDRRWPIDSFTLELEMDPVWRPAATLASRYGPVELGDRGGFLVTAELTYTGEGTPAGVRKPPPAALRAVPFLGAALAMLVLLLRFRDRESELGRFDAPPVPPGLDTAWLEEHLFDLLPEEAGALWDRGVGPPEVAAILARWEAEGRIASEVVPRRGRFERDKLKLELTAERDGFEGYEERLMRKLFFDGRTQTDTEAIRKQYRGRGFDPASEVRSGIERRLRGRGRDLLPHKRLPGPGRRITLGLLLGFLALMALEALGRPLMTLQLGLLLIAPLAPLYLVGLIFAVVYRGRLRRLGWWSLGFVVPALVFFVQMIVAAYFDLLLPGGDFPLQPGIAGTVALAVLAVMVWSSLLNNASSRERPGGLERRHHLAAARRLFAEELRRQRPELLDEWMPYLLALGLGPRVDRWWRRFGGAGEAGSAPASQRFGSSATGAGGGSWTGGGGGFGGAGATASWAAVAGSIASGVARPGSSGSGGGGGGGGGGGSSGGGGGGGW